MVIAVRRRRKDSKAAIASVVGSSRFAIEKSAGFRPHSRDQEGVRGRRPLQLLWTMRNTIFCVTPASGGGVATTGVAATVGVDAGAGAGVGVGASCQRNAVPANDSNQRCCCG